MSEIPQSEESAETPHVEDGPSPDPAPVQRPRRSRAAIALLLLFGLAAIAGGGTAIGYQLTRKPTQAEIDKAGAKEVATRWQRLPAADLFPKQFVFGQQSDPSGSIVQVRRVGIAKPTPCAETVDKSVAAILAKHRCETMLRATYLDPSGLRVVTVGVAVFPDTSSSDDASTDINGLGGGKSPGAGLHIATFPGTTVEKYDDASRQKFEEYTNHTPYLYLRAEGPLLSQGALKPGELVNLQFAPDLVDRIMAKLADDGDPCLRKKDVRC
ncbi:hypothetical protein [Actinomadura gamaensis]|uniref:Uncharacterized protein n=1 Tax=Actinomadura gamaensis TaxID=1763541 RepID=A0ABV9TNZ9_9ACTN